MEITVQFIKMDTSESMTDFAINKLNKLSNKFKNIIKAEVFYKLEKKDPKEKGKICEIQLSLPGPRIFASANKENFEVATDQAIRDVMRQLEKRKEEAKPYS